MADINITIPDYFAVEEATLLREKLYSEISKSSTNITLDFKNCTFIDSTGLGVLVGAHKRCIENHCTLTLANVNVKIMKLLDLTRLNKVFNIR